MKNLILLTESRHAIPTSSSTTEKSNHVLSSVVDNPNVDHDEPLHDRFHDDTNNDNESIHNNITPWKYTLSSSGYLCALSSLDCILWSQDLTLQYITPPNNNNTDNETTTTTTNNWFHLSYNDSTETLVALSNSGAIVSLDPMTGLGELIGSFDYGIICAAWSFDGEVLALVTYQPIDPNDNNINNDDNNHNTSKLMVMAPVLMTMNAQYEILSEVSLPPHDTRYGISLCWNHKSDSPLVAISSHDAEDNTRKIRMYHHFAGGESLSLSSVSRSEDGSGKMIPNILNYHQPLTTAATTTVNSNDYSAGCGCGISWAGANCSNLLACVQKKGKKGRNIVFLESNGLQHGGFKLNMGQDCEVQEVTRIDWNAEHDLLAVTFVCHSDSAQVGQQPPFGKVQLYHRSNYHWYLKYELVYNQGTTVSYVQFDKLKGYQLLVALNCNNPNTPSNLLEWRQYTFIWDTSTTSTAGTAAVIDGNVLNMTRFQQAIIPPPMCAYSLTMDAPIYYVTHVPHFLQAETGINSFELVIVLNSQKMLFCGEKNLEQDKTNMNTRTQRLLDLREIGISDPSCLRQYIIGNTVSLSNDTYVTMVAVECSEASSNSVTTMDDLVYFNVHIDEGGHVNVLSTDKIKLEGKVLRLTNWSNTSQNSEYSILGALIELTDGSLFELNLFPSFESETYVCSGEVMPCDSEAKLLEPCPWISGRFVDEHQRLIIGLSPRFRLYCGERLLNNSASSFVLSESHGFVAYVSLGSRSQLRFLPLSLLQSFDPLIGSDENLDLLGDGYEPREAERGARLVAILPDKPMAILQLPRGNLEATYPRALTLPHVMNKIITGEYHVALDVMRRQKIDMNLVVDMDPTTFLKEGVQKLLKQVQSVDHLNLLIASLANHDITLWKYRVPKWFRRNQSNETSSLLQNTYDFTAKVNEVCTKLRNVMIKMEAENEVPPGHFLLPILSTFAKEQPPKLEEALSLIKDNASSTGGKVLLLSDKVQSSIQYLAFMADYELLFDTALGMYDFDLAKAVARNSQMDPKVYIPMLKRLMNLPEYTAKYEVDLKLKRYEPALRNLFLSGKSSVSGEDDDEQAMNIDNFNKCIEFIEEHGLYHVGLELFCDYTEYHQKVMILLGNNLMNENKASSALSIFLATTPKYYEGALRAARECGDWRTYFSCLFEDNTLIEKSGKSLVEIATQVASEISAGRNKNLSRRQSYAESARILLDYCGDISGALDMLISAEMWFESRRVALLHGSSDLVNRVIEAASSYSYTCTIDLEQRSEKFEEANKRYYEVVKIRKEAKREGEGEENHQDETGSLFSLASRASNMSTLSTASAGSVSSVSSVISAGNVSTFTITGDDSLRHKSKFNNIGRDRKKKKKTSKREKLRLKPGSEEELKSLVLTLQGNVVDNEYFSIIVETINFLVQVGLISTARELYDAYQDISTRVEKSQRKRQETVKDDRQTEERNARKEGQYYENVTLSCEEEVDSLQCKALPAALHDLFTYTI